MTGIEATTEDHLLKGRIALRQPAKGHRAGTDAVLLAASVRAEAGHRVADLGAGVGSVGLMIATRCPGCQLTLVEIDPMLAELARQNVAANSVQADVLEQDVTSLSGSRDGFDHVVMNPPFHPASARSSPDPRTARAHVGGKLLTAEWIAAAFRLLRPGGILTLIHRADALAEILAAMPGFGGVVITPVHPRGDGAASRVVVAAVRDARGPLVLERPLILNVPGVGFTPEAQAAHDGAALERAWPVPSRKRPLRPSHHQPR